MEDKQGGNEGKDFWDKLRALGPIVSGILIALIGGIFTYSYRKQEMAIREVAAFQAYISHLKVPAEREIALVMIEHFGENELAMKIVKTGVQGTEGYGDEKMRTGPQTDQTATPKDTIVSIPKDTIVSPALHARLVTATGWVYLGDYSSETKQWRTKYFDFRGNPDPYALTNQSLRVSADAINIREGMPNEAAEFGGVIGVLKANSAVKILSVKPWLSTGYMWARVEYTKKPVVLK